MKSQTVNSYPRCLTFAELIVVLSACLLCVGCPESKSRILEDDSEAIIALKKAGAEIYRVPAMGAPNMRAVSVDLKDVKIDTEIMGHLAQVGHITELKLTGESVTDDTVNEFGEWKYLLTLDLGGTAVTNAGLERLGAFKGLNALTLTDTKVTGAGLEKIPPSLTSLILNNTQVSDSDLKNLNHMKRLRILSLVGTQVTKAGVTEFKKTRPNLLTVGIKMN